MLSLRAVAKSFSEGHTRRPVLNDLSLDVAKGEFVAITGASGAGKSTLLNIIAGIEPADAGEVVCAGSVLTGLDDHARTLHRRRHIGFVFQFFNLMPTLTVAENLRLPLALVGRDDRSLVHEWLSRVGLSDRSKAMPEDLSGGEQQRVAVARALIHQPQLVLADEPTGNLDATTAHRVVSLLAALCRDQSTTLIVVTHARAVSQAAARELELSQGRLRQR